MKYSITSTSYVLSCMPSIRKDYANGSSCASLAVKYNLSYSCIRNRLKKEGLIRSISDTKTAELNPQWKGDKVGNQALHNWVARRLPKPEFCEDCNVAPPKDLANIKNTLGADTYNRNLNNWNWLCRRCHMLRDGRINNLVHIGNGKIRGLCSFKDCNGKHEAKGFCNKHYKIYRKTH